MLQYYLMISCVHYNSQLLPARMVQTYMHSVDDDTLEYCKGKSFRNSSSSVDDDGYLDEKLSRDLWVPFDDACMHIKEAVTSEQLLFFSRAAFSLSARNFQKNTSSLHFFRARSFHQATQSLHLHHRRVLIFINNYRPHFSPSHYLIAYALLLVMEIN